MDKELFMAFLTPSHTYVNLEGISSQLNNLGSQTGTQAQNIQLDSKMTSTLPHERRFPEKNCFDTDQFHFDRRWLLQSLKLSMYPVQSNDLSYVHDLGKFLRFMTSSTRR